MGRVLELVDLDGTTNTLDVRGALENNEDGEILAYVRAASEFVAKSIGLDEKDYDEVFEGIKGAMLADVYPNRARLAYWGTFPMGDGGAPMPVTPAVDHMQLTKPAVEIYLKMRMDSEPAESDAAKKIRDFLSGSWGFDMFAHASKASLDKTHIEQDAVVALESRLSKDALIAILTNSSPEKATSMLRRAGFGDRIVENGVERGKIGSIGNGRKWWVNTGLPASSVDLSRYYPDNIQLDIRRGDYKKLVAALMAGVDADEVAMFTDIPELDLYPLREWYGNNARLGMKTNPVSAPESISAAKGILGASVNSKLSALMAEVLD